MELIKIYNGKLVDARELHIFLGSKRDFSNWINQRIKKYGFEEGIDYTSYNKIVEREKGATRRIEYTLTLNMAKELAMVENNAKGREARLYFIKAEEALQELKNNKRLEAFVKLESTKEKFKNHVIGLGGNESDYIQIDYKSRKMLFNGSPFEDEVLNTVLLKGRDFAIAMTNGGILEGDIKDMNQVEQLSEESHKDVRDAIIKNVGKAPEELPREEKIKKLEE